jgi:hypothetical protein
MTLGLKVIAVDGTKPSLGKLALREILGKFLDGLTLGIGYLMVAFTAKKRGLHDIIADTVVIYDPARKRRPWLVGCAITFILIIPIVGIFSSIFLASLNSARQKGAAISYGKNILSEIKICQQDGGNVNAYMLNEIICDAKNHNMTWPDISSTDWELSAAAAENAKLNTYTFIMKADQSDIVCSLAENDCK